MVYEEAIAWVNAHASDESDDAARALMALIEDERTDERSKTRQEAADAVMAIELRRPRHQAAPRRKRPRPGSGVGSRW